MAIVNVLENNQDRYFVKGNTSNKEVIKYIGGSVSLEDHNKKDPPNVIYLEHNKKPSIRSIPGYLCKSNNKRSIFVKIANLPSYNMNNLLTYVDKSDFQITDFYFTSEQNNNLMRGSIQAAPPITWHSQEKDLWDVLDKSEYKDDLYVAAKRSRKRRYRGSKKMGSVTKRLKSNYRRKKTKRSY